MNPPSKPKKKKKKKKEKKKAYTYKSNSSTNHFHGFDNLRNIKSHCFDLME